MIDGEIVCIHAYPQIVFSGTKITKIRNTVSFSGTNQLTYSHIYEINTATRFYRKIKEQYTMHLPYRFRAAENAVCRSRSTVRQSNHFTKLLRTSESTQASPSSSTVTKGHFSWYAFLNVWKRLLFAGDGFAGA